MSVPDNVKMVLVQSWYKLLPPGVVTPHPPWLRHCQSLTNSATYRERRVGGCPRFGRVERRRGSCAALRGEPLAAEVWGPFDEAGVGDGAGGAAAGGGCWVQKPQHGTPVSVSSGGVGLSTRSDTSFKTV